MASNDDEVSQVPEQLMEQLLKGYDALNAEFKSLNDRRRELEHKLGWAKQQYSDVLKRYSPDTATQETNIFEDELDEAAACEQNGQIDWLEHMSNSTDADSRTRAFNMRVANDAREKLRNRQQEVQGVKIWKTAEKRGSTSSRLRNELERDYTTPGTPSRLGCPFAATGNGRVPSLSGQRSLPTPRSTATSRLSGSLGGSGRRRPLPISVDPIRAEICGNDPASPVISVNGSSAVCPIRFLDQHSAEEVAQYFERHKHEIPRSHEVCVKRYQSNAEQIRQLDSKYGNLVSMIKGLGEKHQPWLPDKAEDEELEEGPKQESVKRWANAVSVQSEDGHVEEKVDPVAGEGEADRQPHFDRPLKEVRVGESPSRPWGIRVPADDAKTGSVSSESSAHTASPQELSAPPPVGNMDGATPKPAVAVKCPFDHSKFAAQQMPIPPAASTGPTPQEAHGGAIPRPTFLQAPPTAQKGAHVQAERHQMQPQTVFNGPVFIGYPVEQALQVLREIGLGCTP